MPMEKGYTYKHQCKSEGEIPDGIDFSEEFLLPHDISYITNRYAADDAYVSQIWQIIPELISCVNEV
jgi:hypothetical protein